MSFNAPFWISVSVCGVLAIIAGVTYGTLLPKDSSQNTKLLTIVTVFSFVASLIAYALALYHFSHNPGQMIQFMLLIVMLIVLPCSLISASIATVTVSNMRDTLATGNQ